MEVPQKIKNGTTIWPSNSSYGCMKKRKTLIWRDIWTPCSFTVVKMWKQPQCLLVDQWRGVCVCVCVHSIENTASNILITVYHDMVMTYLWDHFLLYKNIKLLCTPETNRILCINCTSIKKNEVEYVYVWWNRMRSKMYWVKKKPNCSYIVLFVIKNKTKTNNL